MQFSQLYRRGVVLPLYEAAAEQLRALWIENSIRTQWLPVLSESQFSLIWDSEILQRINAACGTEISDYEEVELAVSGLESVLNALRTAPKSESREVAAFARNLESMILDGIDSKMPVYFIL